jgi:sec-independent protein translocase protein TatA
MSWPWTPAGASCDTDVKTALEFRSPVLSGQESVSMRLGIPELVVILMIVVLIFGASRLPELGRGIGKGIKNFKDATKDGSKPEES